jgi:hypothetical protein
MDRDDLLDRMIAAEKRWALTPAVFPLQHFSGGIQ